MERREARFRARRLGIARPPDVEPDAVMRVLRVPPELAGMRLDRFVQGELRATSRTRSKLIILNSAFSPEGRHLKKNRRVEAEERVILWRPPWDELAPEVDLSVVYEDDSLLALNKPPFIPVHPTARFHRSTVTMLIADQRPDDHLTLMHRLDRETSGVLLLARTRAADRAVKIQFEDRKSVLKRYLAITWNAPSWDRRTCELPLEPDDRSPYRVKMRAAAPGAGQPSATTFEVLERAARGDRGYALVRCTLHTGRQHQIRVHLSALGLPLVGDKLYGPDETLFARGADGELTEADRAVLELDRQALHAADMEIDHPESGERLRIEAPLYPDMETFWDSLRGKP
ncbi:MAG: RluA family pseudouridine synthase [Deltaproteobacteria bacterium]|nr:RluA family pseudouridine synthase [Deltaproteobacteria bacterium]